MKKLFALLCILAGCWAVGNLQSAEQAVAPEPDAPAVYEFTVPSVKETKNRLSVLAEDLRGFLGLFSVEKQSETAEYPSARYIITIQG